MLKHLGKWLKIYQDELGLFLWSALVLFLIRSSNILFNNFAETAFLKRFGVEYLPYVAAVNSVATFFVMGFLSGFMVRIPGNRLLANALLICGSSVAVLRFVVPLQTQLVYPLLYILKTQYEVLLAFLFWNLANDLFNTRQSKRIFPLITAGGIVGGILGSFGTPLLAGAISLDNLMFAYLVTTVAGAVVVNKMGNLYPAVLLIDKGPKRGKSKSSVIGEIKQVLPILRQSKLVKILVLLTLLPNIVIPIINYQFSFAVDQTFDTEGGMIQFFGYFRGAQNVIALFISLFVGRIYARFGLPVALMFHPFNYVLAFLAFLLRFDVFSAMYARLSTVVLRNAINNPARAVLMGLFPISLRAVVRPFLRGIVVRVGVLTGSGLILLSQGVIDPRYLSLVALPFVIAWIGTTFPLKRSYSKILLDLISQDMIDLKSMEVRDVTHLFKYKEVRSHLVKSFMESRGETSLWYARLLKSLGTEGLDTQILKKIREEDDSARVQLLPLLSSQAREEAMPVFRELIDPGKPELMVALARTAKRLYADTPLELQQEIFENAGNPEVEAIFMLGLYPQDPLKYNGIIERWLASNHLPEKRAGVLAAGESENPGFIEKLKTMLQEEDDEAIISLILKALSDLKSPDTYSLVLPYLTHGNETVRLAALDVFKIDSDYTERKVIGLMDDPSDKVHSLAIEKLRNSPYQNPQILVESLGIPSRRIREGLFKVAEFLDIKDLEFFRFARFQIEQAYKNLAVSEALRSLPNIKGRDLLIEHQVQKKGVHLDNVLRVLSARDGSGKIRIILRGLYSVDSRKQSNSLEALENMLDRSLAKIMTPLFENVMPRECLTVGRREFDLPDFASDQALLFGRLLKEDDWVTVALILNLIKNLGPEIIDKETIQKLGMHESLLVPQMTQQNMKGQLERGEEEHINKTGLSITDRIFCLKSISLFESLSVSELARVALDTKVEYYRAGEPVTEQGCQRDDLFLIIKGQVSVTENRGDERPSDQTRRLGTGEPIGLLGFFEDIPTNISIRAIEDTHLLALGKQAFVDIVNEYPEIVLPICKVMCFRIRMLAEEVKKCEKMISDGQS